VVRFSYLTCSIYKGILADITFLELFPVVISVHIWGIHLKNKRIIFNVDNQAVVAIINKKSSKSAVLYVFHVDLAAEALISEFSSPCKFSIDGLEFLLARGLLLGKES
jgi:hypothetical protein